MDNFFVLSLFLRLRCKSGSEGTFTIGELRIPKLGYTLTKSQAQFNELVMIFIRSKPLDLAPLLR